MTYYELHNIDGEDIEDLIQEVEKSFQIEFVGDELLEIDTFGELCDIVTSKIQLEDCNDCTSQQAFYKLRESISQTLQIGSKKISVNFPLRDILPRRERRSRIRKLELHIGFKLNIVRPPHWVTWTLVALFFASFVSLSYSWQIGLLGLTFSIGGFCFANKIGNELDLQTVGQVAEKMMRQNYLESRRNPKTFNKRETEKVLTDWFTNHFRLDKNKFTRESKFAS